jgi:hypothetical protein
MKAAIEATMSSKEMGSYKASTVFIICLPPHSAHKMYPLDNVFMGLPKKIFAKIFKSDSVQTQGDSSSPTKLANCAENTSKLKQTRQRLMAAV